MASFINSSDEEDLCEDELSSTQFNSTYWVLPGIGLSDEEDEEDEEATPVPVTVATPATPAEVPVSVEHDISQIEDFNNSVNRTYLITYSQANMGLFSTREKFGEACVAAFGGLESVNYYCVGLEDHGGGGKHYQVSILLSKPKRWHGARQHLSSCGAEVHFSTSGKMYAGAYFYTTKADKDYYHGDASNQTYRGNIAAKRPGKSAAASSTREGKKEKPKRFCKLDVVDIINQHYISNDDELLLYAKERRNNVGDNRLLEYLIKIGDKQRGDLLCDAKKLECCAENVALAKTKRVDIIKAILDDGHCTCTERGLWFVLALDICVKNNIEREVMGGAFYKAIKNGRKKHGNILILGEANCGKTFLLGPLRNIFKKLFTSPAASGFGWDKADDAQVILLNDYRWFPLDKKGNIAWDAFLRLLEGDDAKLPAPMNHKAEHYVISKENDVPIFCTSGTEITWWKKDPDEAQTKRHKRENKMMAERWHKPFYLTYEFSEDKKADCEPCAWCFCKFMTV